MIKVTVTRSRRGDIVALKVSNHGAPLVCAAVSALVINAVNSLKTLTEENFSCEYVEEGGLLEVIFQGSHESGLGRDARLLTASLMLGLRSVLEEYPSDIVIEDKETAL